MCKDFTGATLRSKGAVPKGIGVVLDSLWMEEIQRSKCIKVDTGGGPCSSELVATHLKPYSNL